MTMTRGCTRGGRGGGGGGGGNEEGKGLCSTRTRGGHSKRESQMECLVLSNHHVACVKDYLSMKMPRYMNDGKFGFE